MSRQRRVVSWLALVRAAIPRCAEPFSAYDVVRAMGIDPGRDGVRFSVFDVLFKLAENRELVKSTRKRGEKRTVSVFTRTAAFRAEEFNFEAQRQASDFLQGLAVQWGNQRNHAAAE